MKKLVSLLLALTMLMSLVPFAVAAADEDKPYEGMTLTIWDHVRRFYLKDITDPAATNTDPAGTGTLVAAAIDEWARENGVTIKLVQGDINALQASMNAGDVPDLVTHYGNVSQVITSGMARAWDEETTAYFAEKYGQQWLQTVSMGDYCYGITHPWNGLNMMCYNRTLCDEYGIKTPDQYFMEGNWTWETYVQFMKDCTMDVYGDGSLYTIGGCRPHQLTGVFQPFTLDEQGHLVSLLNTERMRAGIEALYTLYTVNKSLADVNNGGLVMQDNTYIMCGFGQTNVYAPGGIYSVTADGYTKQWVPLPQWKADDPDYAIKAHYIYSFTPNGADPEKQAAALDLLDYILEHCLAEMDEASGNLLGYGFEQMKGDAGLSKEIMDAREVKLAELTADQEENISEFDQEYVEAVIKYMASQKKIYTLDDQYNGMYIDLAGGTYKSLWTMPPATSLAEWIPVIEAKVAEYNTTIVDPFIAAQD